MMDDGAGGEDCFAAPNWYPGKCFCLLWKMVRQRLWSLCLPPSIPPSCRLFSLIFFLPPSSAAECAESTVNNSLIHGRVVWRRTDFPKAIPHLLYFAVSMETGHFLHRNVPSIVSRIGGKSNSVGARSQTRGVICSALNNLTASGEQNWAKKLGLPSFMNLYAALMHTINEQTNRYCKKT